MEGKCRSKGPGKGGRAEGHRSKALEQGPQATGLEGREARDERERGEAKWAHRGCESGIEDRRGERGSKSGGRGRGKGLDGKCVRGGLLLAQDTRD
jgi:hypothetical protein